MSNCDNWEDDWENDDDMDAKLKANIEETKSPCSGRGFGWDKIGVKGVSLPSYYLRGLLTRAVQG